MPRSVCRFEYLYRDASNYKGCGSLVLWGEATPGNEAAIRAALIDGMYFEAERVGVPTLYHLVRGDAEPDEAEDHGWHEFLGLNPPGDWLGEVTMELTMAIERLQEAMHSA